MASCERSVRSSGFAYLWVLISVALMGVSLALAGEIYATSLRRDQEEQLLAIGRQFQRAFLSYRNATPAGEVPYPGSLRDLLEDRRGPVMRRHLRKVFVDPMTGLAEWGEVRVGGRITGVHSLATSAPIKRAGFGEGFEGFDETNRFKDWFFGLDEK